MKFSPEYWNNYYGGRYEETYKLGFPLAKILKKDWANFYQDLPQSFADIGCGLGHTLIEAQSLLLPNSLIYGVEYQEMPQERTVAQNIYLGDFMKIYPQLPQVDLLYVSCSMYIPFPQQLEFLTAAVSLAKKALVFANVYLEDGSAIPEDLLRKSIYRDRKGFRSVMGSLGFKFNSVDGFDFFVPA